MTCRTAQRAIDSNGNDFEGHLGHLKTKNFEVLWRQDWFVVDWFKRLASNPHLFPNKHEYRELIAQGMEAVSADDIDKLRAVVHALDSRKIGSVSEEDVLAAANIVQA